MPLDWNRFEVRLVSAMRCLCTAGWRLSHEWCERLADFDLWYVFRGRGTMQLTDQRISLHPGVCLWMRPGRLYLGEQDPDDMLGVHAIHFELVDPAGVRHRRQQTVEALGFGSLPPEPHLVADTSYGDSLLRRVEALYRLPGDEPKHAAESLLKGLLRDLDAQVERTAGVGGTPRHHDELVSAAAARMDESPGDCPPIREMARQAGYSPDHFARVFRARLGLSPQAYLVRARIDHARRLLQESSLPLGRIADILGYADVYFFSRQFKQKTGRTPGAYRRRPASTFDAH